MSILAFSALGNKQQGDVVFEVIVGHSNKMDSEEAIADVLTQCTDQLSGKQPQASILLAAVDFDHPLILALIQDTFPKVALIGGTTD
ncbi:MAG: hypothetical protein AAFZ17_14065 [Cyanobacteria bacterium J06650_10]